MGIMESLYDKLNPTHLKKFNKSMLEYELKKIAYPGKEQNIFELGLVKHLTYEQGKVEFFLDIHEEDTFHLVHRTCKQELLQLPSVKSVSIKGPQKAPKQAAPGPHNKKNHPSKIANIIAVASGKGGVGKSTVAFHVAQSLQKSGFKVGILDADIYGPSIPTLSHVGMPTMTENDKVLPPLKDGMKIVSISMFTQKDQAQILRGPMAANLAKQFISNVAWGELDYLIIDFPPGTGDIQLSLAQFARITAAIVVTTPHELAIKDVRKSIEMLNTLKIPILGIVENMSYFLCDGCDKKHYIFDHTGGETLAKESGFPLLAKIPIKLDKNKQASSLQGRQDPLAVDPVYEDIVKKVHSELHSLKNMKSEYLESFNLKWTH